MHQKLFTILFILLLSNNIYAKNSAVKTNIKSKIVKIVKDKNFIEFKGNVILVQEDISFLANQMLVFIDKNKKMSDKAEIQLIKAKGKVKIFNQEFIATGDSGIYDVDKDIFKIFGDVILNEGTKIAYGTEFIYDVSNKKGSLSSSVKNNDGKVSRPTVIIHEDLNNLKQGINEDSDN